ncbi:hypothetical protein H0H93_006899 [Arthromyces matolae]|nr:hypothetical protein H0H93_006899 [Arthromyces matolae]
MECLQNRIDSFSKPKRVKNPAKQSSFVSVKWKHPPHPRFIATPETLAEAGFYFNPSFEDRDNVACFICDKQLAAWEAEDDPFDTHWDKCGDKCSWAIVRCGLKVDINRHGGFTFTDKSRVPTSKAMEKARLDTFSAGEGWIHDQVADHGANSRKMARAGFIFTPQRTGDDLATCLYCEVALSGWEAGDDPMEEHRKRQRKPCPMFNSSDPPSKPPSRAPSNKPSSKSQPSKRARSVSKSKHIDSVQPMKTYDGEESDTAPSSSERSRPVVSSKSAKTKKISRSQSRTELQDVAENEEDEEIEEVAPRTGRGRAKKSIGLTTKMAKSRSKSMAPRASSDDEEPPTKARTKTRSRVKGKEKASVADDVSTQETEAEGQSKTKKSTRGKTPARTEEQEAEEEQEVKALKKSSRGRVKESEDEEADKEPEEKPLKKSTRKRAPPRTEKSEEEEEEVTQTIKKPSRTKPPSQVEETAIITSSRKASKSRKVKDRQTEAQSASEPEHGMSHTAAIEGVGDIFQKPPSRSRAKSSASRKPSRARAKATPMTVDEDEAELEEDVIDVLSDDEDGGSRGERSPQEAEPARRSLLLPTTEVDVSSTSKPTSERTRAVVQQQLDSSIDSASNRPTTPPTSTEDVEMLNAEPEVEPLVQTQPVDEAPPRTPQPPTVPVKASTPEPLFVPPLSKLPFTPLQNLTEAELDMTVEEWIRYQMEVEYDKLKRDGEREIGRFKKRAEETKKVGFKAARGTRLFSLALQPTQNPEPTNSTPQIIHNRWFQEVHEQKHAKSLIFPHQRIPKTSSQPLPNLWQMMTSEACEARGLGRPIKWNKISPTKLT